MDERAEQRLEESEPDRHEPEDPVEDEAGAAETRPEAAHIGAAGPDPLTATEEVGSAFDDESPDADSEAAVEQAAGDDAPVAAEEAAMTVESDEEQAAEEDAAEAASELAEVVEVVDGEHEEEEEEEEPDYMFQLGDWYVVHTYAGYENKVKANLASRIQSMNMEDKIYEVVVPTEEVMELKAGKMQSVQKKVFPGYILVRMELDDDSWYVVRNTPGVTGFVGPTGAKPVPLDPSEVAGILAPKAEERPRPQLEFEQGEVVSVVGGAFNGYSGPVSTIDVDKQRVTVLLDLFGRETPVELTFDQVTKL
jgi:transcriptional antiterminator NusG